MKLKNDKSGFTLMEIIIVIVIVGFLASLALPRLFNVVEFARATEALNAIGTIKRAADRCALVIEANTGIPDEYDGCDSFEETGAEDPSFPSTVFDYAINNFSAPIWSIVATRVGSAADGDTITFTYDILSGDTTRSGNPGGAYASLN